MGACTFCKKRKRKCDGKEPCSVCQKYNRGGECQYPVDQDKRKFKYDSTYIDYLEVKVDILQQLADVLIKSDPVKANEIDCEFVKASQDGKGGSLLNEEEEELLEMSKGSKQNTAEQLLRRLANDEAIDELISTKWRVRKDTQGHTEFYGPVSGRQQVVENTEDEAYPLIANKNFDLVTTSQSLKHELLDLFAKHFAQYFYSSWTMADEVKTWDFPSRNLSKQLLMCSMFAYGSLMGSNQRELTAFFIQQAESILLKAINNVDEIVIQASLILSCYYLGMGLDSNSWALDAMASSMTQYMKLDRQIVKKDERISTALIQVSQRSTSIFWSVILQDRIITSVLGRGCRIQYFRITTPFYQPILSDKTTNSYWCELTFAHHSRLWYIYDMYLSQIYSFKADYLHDSHKLTLMNEGIQSLSQFKSELPSPLQLSPEVTDSKILVLHLSYSVVFLLLHRAYLRQIPLKVIQITIEHCEIAAGIIQRLHPEPNFDSPYFISYLILTVATFDLFLLSSKDDSLKPAASKRIETHVEALLVHGKYWRRCIKDIKVLQELASRWQLDIPCLRDAIIKTQEGIYDYHSSSELNDNIDVSVFMNQFTQSSTPNSYQNHGSDGYTPPTVDFPAFDIEQLDNFFQDSRS